MKMYKFYFYFKFVFICINIQGGHEHGVSAVNFGGNKKHKVDLFTVVFLSYCVLLASGVGGIRSEAHN